MKFDTQYCQSNCLHDLSWYVHDHNYMNLIQYELLLSSSTMLSENNKYASLEICQIWAELFYMLAWKWDHEIFMIIMKDIEKVLELKSYADSWSFVSEKYHDLIDVFERQHANELLSHWEKYDIEINLKLEKILNFEFLYSMLQEKLQVL